MAEVTAEVIQVPSKVVTIKLSEAEAQRMRPMIAGLTADNGADIQLMLGQALA